MPEQVLFLPTGMNTALSGVRGPSASRAYWNSPGNVINVHWFVAVLQADHLPFQPLNRESPLADLSNKGAFFCILN